MLYRTIWLSDLHLGTRGCSASKLLEFLKDNDAETIYLVGDIIDGWRLSKKFYWPQSHNDIIQKLLRKSRKGTKIVYVCGNHDEFLRPFIGITMGDIELVNEYVHTMADGKKFLIIHGDSFDGITTHYKYLALIGDISYVILLWLNRWHLRIRKALGFKHWSLSAYLKRKVKQAANFINNYENAIANECKRRNFEGIICGHVHHAEIKNINEVVYCNIGDFVESCTALAEDFDGNLHILRMNN